MCSRRSYRKRKPADRKAIIALVEPDAAGNPLRVQKEKQLIIATLRDQTRIQGFVHLPQSGRLTDLMNLQAAERPFLAVTEAVVRLPDGTRHYTPFLTLNRHAITTCFPAEEEDQEKLSAGAT